jgi:hypothetical protein
MNELPILYNLPLDPCRKTHCLEIDKYSGLRQTYILLLRLFLWSMSSEYSEITEHILQKVRNCLHEKYGRPEFEPRVNKVSYFFYCTIKVK